MKPTDKSRLQIDTAPIDAALKAGGICLLPTETVYGLAVDPKNTEAVKRLYHLKGRHFNKPLAFCVSNRAQAETLGQLSPLARALIECFWPGPLSLIVPANAALFKKRSHYDPRLFGTDANGTHTVGLRCPDIFWMASLKRLPLALTSANRSGDPDPHTFKDAFEAVGKDVQAVIDVDVNQPQTQHRLKRGNLPSTILSISGQSAKLVRLGALTQDDFSKFEIEWR